MARFLSKTLIRDSQYLVRDFPPSTHLLHGQRSRLLSARLRSDRPEFGQLVEIDLGQGSDAANVEVEVLSLRRLEDAIQILIIQKSAPAWIPFVPGSSYWVPPRRLSHGIGLGIPFRMEKSLNEEEALSRNTQRGWPASSYFVDGIMPVHRSTKMLKKAASGSASQSDEDE